MRTFISISFNNGQANDRETNGVTHVRVSSTAVFILLKAPERANLVWSQVTRSVAAPWVGTVQAIVNSIPAAVLSGVSLAMTAIAGTKTLRAEARRLCRSRNIRLTRNREM